MAGRIELHAPAEEQLKRAMEQCCDKNLPVRQWESVIFRRRVKNYSETMLDRLLAQGDYFWKMAPDGNLSFHRYDDIDWGAGLPEAAEELEGRTAFVPGVKRRGASFLKFLTGIPKEDSAQEVLLKLAAKGLVCADSFVPVRQWQNRRKSGKRRSDSVLTAQGSYAVGRALGYCAALSGKKSREELLLRYFTEAVVLCRETFQKASMGG